jgi:serine/threonine-protein kinase
MSRHSFGKYMLLAELGHGGMADVFLAAVQGPGGFSKLQVLKCLRKNLADDPEFVTMLVDEARLAARLNHPNVVQTLEVGNVGNQYFIAMEYLEGQPMNRVAHRAKGRDDVPNKLFYGAVLDALAGLHHAHELADYDGTPLEVVHRDVSPHNIFITYDGQAKIVDFGIAKAAGRIAETRQGVVKGKVQYMAPEQAMGGKVDRRVDIFAVGVILYEIATGGRMWKGMEEIEIFRELAAGRVRRSPREIVPGVPEALDRICQKALAPDAAERYATALELQADLEAFLESDGGRLSAREAGKLVAKLFEDRRVETRALIEQKLSELKAAPSAPVSMANLKVDTSSSTLTPSSGREASLTPAEARATTSSSKRTASVSKDRAGAVKWIALTGVVCLAAAAVVVLRSNKQEPATQTPPPTASARAHESAAVTVSQPVPQSTQTASAAALPSAGPKEAPPVVPTQVAAAGIPRGVPIAGPTATQTATQTATGASAEPDTLVERPAPSSRPKRPIDTESPY